MGYVDVDTHGIETNATWEYLDPQEREYKPQCVVTEDGDDSVRMWIVDNAQFPYGRTTTSNVVTLVEREARDLRDVPLRVKWMDKLGVDYQVAYPSIFIGLQIRKPDLQAALARSYNRWMADVHAQSKGRILWAAVPAVGDLDRAIEDITEARKHGAVAVFVRPVEANRFLTDHYFDPLFAAAQELDMAIGVHMGFCFESLLVDPNGVVAFNAVPNAATCMNLLKGDISARFPKLRFGLLESSASWIPFALQEARRAGLGGWREVREVTKDSLAEKNIFVAATIDDDIGYLIGQCGTETLVLGSDFGHADRGTDIECHSILMSRTDADRSALQKIVDTNGRKLYGLRPSLN
jgi:predicted TIM-barrel fold metal-dependent hydrolase